MVSTSLNIFIASYNKNVERQWGSICDAKFYEFLSIYIHNIVALWHLVLKIISHNILTSNIYSWCRKYATFKDKQRSTISCFCVLDFRNTLSHWNTKTLYSCNVRKYWWGTIYNLRSSYTCMHWMIKRRQYIFYEQNEWLLQNKFTCNASFY